jgi:hypothetical protein
MSRIGPITAVDLLPGATHPYHPRAMYSQIHFAPFVSVAPAMAARSFQRINHREKDQ